MVGMSGKGSEPRRGQTQVKKQSSVSTPALKPQPSAEALRMAQMLGDKYPPDLSEKIQQVVAVVPGRGEWEVCIALHDHDFDPEKAITALLDSDASQGEWTTPGRKGKKKTEVEGELIMPPGDKSSRSSSARTARGTNRAASQSTREGYGGSVALSSEGGRGRGRGRSQSGSRGRSTSNRRPERTRPPVRSRGSAPKDRPRTHPQSPQTGSAPTSGGFPPKESWDSEPVAPPPEQQLGTEVWGEGVPVALPSASEWEREVSAPSGPLEVVGSWEATPTDHTPLFPEAIPTPLATHSESTSVATATEDSRERTQPSEHNPPPPELTHKRPGRHRHKRIARSQIPTKPVEMPGSIDALDVQFGTLGINFAGLEPEGGESQTPSPIPSHFQESTTSSQQLVEATSLLTYSTVQPFTEDPGVISMSATVESYQGATPPKTEGKLEAPPGLSHPSEQGEKPPLLPPEPLTLPQGHSSPPHPPTEVPPLPLPLPHLDHLPSTTITTTLTETHPRIEQPTSHSFQSVTTVATVAELLPMTAPHPYTSSSTLSSASSSRTSQSQHTGPQGKHGVPPNMVYQHMMPQYHFGMMPMTPYYDPSAEMNRYTSVAYYQHHPSSDPAIAGALSRDHSSSGFPTEASKFGRGSDVASPVSSNPTQQTSTQQAGGLQQGQQMGHAFMNTYPYGSMFYPMYPTVGMAGFSAPSMGPKPSGGSTFPGVSTYQTPTQGYSYEDMNSTHDLSRYTALGKSGGLPSTSGSSDLSSFKHQPFDSKSGSAYSYSMPMGGSGGYMGGFMQVPTVPMQHMPPVVPTHDGAGSRGQKHKQLPYWSQGSHTS